MKSAVSSKTLSKLDQSIEEHLSGRSADYNGRGQTTWFAGYVSLSSFPVPYHFPIPSTSLVSLLDMSIFSGVSPHLSLKVAPNRQNCRKSSVSECIFDYMALQFIYSTKTHSSRVLFFLFTKFPTARKDFSFAS